MKTFIDHFLHLTTTELFYIQAQSLKTKLMSNYQLHSKINTQRTSSSIILFYIYNNTFKKMIIYNSRNIIPLSYSFSFTDTI